MCSGCIRRGPCTDLDLTIPPACRYPEGMSDWQTKAWGRKRLIYRDDRVIVEEIEIVAGGYCSVHRHRKNANAFIVQSGRLLVHFYSAGEPCCLDADLHCKQIRVNYDVWHQFVAASPVQALEIYTSDFNGPIDAGDIERAAGSVGGVLGTAKERS